MTPEPSTAPTALLKAADIAFLCDLAREAGDRIMRHYHDEVEVTAKADQSPLTAADRDSHELIVARLRERWPDWPVLSEEGADVPYEERRQWEIFWLVDPLDGTKEFLKRNGEFTVNIALIVGEKPVFGVVYAPATCTLYHGGVGYGAFRQSGHDAREPIHCRKAGPSEPLTVVGSRSHGSPEMEGFLEHLEVRELIAVGSSLKFCRVAEGTADLYPRFGPTMEWDTAAGHAVVVGAGGTVSGLAGQPMRYNKRELLNQPFMVSGSVRQPSGDASTRSLPAASRGR